MNTRTILVSYAAACFVAFSPAARAAVVEITASATITSATAVVPDYITNYQNPFVVGDTITATFAYSTDANYGVVPIHQPVTAYWPAYATFTTETGASWANRFSYFEVGTSDITFSAPVDTRYVSAFPQFGYTAQLFFREPFADVPPSTIDALAFLGGTITGMDLPTPWLSAYFTARIDRISAVATPLPGSAWLLATALAGLAALGRKRSARRARSANLFGIPSLAAPT